MWFEYSKIYTDRDTSYADSEYIAPVSIASANVGPRTMITRSMTRKFEKNEILKKIFQNQISRYPLRNRLDDSTEGAPNYYESEDSDTDTRVRQLIKRRRHSVGAILQTVKVDNPINEPKIICCFCHLQKLLESVERKPMAEVIKKLKCRRKSMSNAYVADKRKHHVSRYFESEDNILQCKCVESKNAAKKIARDKLHQRSKSDSNILNIKNKGTSIKKHSLELENKEKSGSKGWEGLPITEKAVPKKILPRRKSEGVYKKVESGEKSETKRLHENKAENTDKKRRKSESNIVFAPYFTSSPNAKAESTENSVVKRRECCENTAVEIVTKKLMQRRKSESSILHIKNRENSSENVMSKPVTKKTSQSKCSPDTTKLKSKSIVQRRSSSKTNQKKPTDHSSKKEKSSDTTKKLESKPVSQKGHTERQTHTEDKHSSDKSKKSDIKNYSKCDKQKSFDRIITLEPKKTSQKPSGSETSHKTEKAVSKDADKKTSQKPSGSETSHKTEKAISKNADTKKPSANELKSCVDSKGKHSERSSTSREPKENESAGRIEKGHSENTKNSHKRCSESDSLHKNEKGEKDHRRRSESGSSRSKEREHSTNVKTQSKQEHGEKKRSSEKSIVSSEVTNLSKKRQSEGETSRAKEKEYSKKSSESKHRELQKKVDKDTRCATEKLHKDTKSNTEHTSGKKRSLPYDDKKASSEDAKKHFEEMPQRSSKDKNSLPVKRASYEIKRKSSLSPLCKISHRRKSDSAALTSASDGFKSHTSPKKRKMSCEDNHMNSLVVSIEKTRPHEGSEKNSDLNLNDERAQIVSKPRSSTVAESCRNDTPSTPLQTKRIFSLNISSGETTGAAGGEINKLAPVITIIPSNEEGQADDNLLTVEDQLKEIFHDTIDSEIDTEELIQILSTSSENLGEAFEKSLISDAVQMCLESRSAGQGTSQVITVVDNCGKHSRQISEARNIRESRETDTSQKLITERRSDGSSSDMTKMEHYKKRLIQQHEKPSLMRSPPPATEEDSDSPSQSPTNPSQNNHQGKKKEEATRSKVAKKRTVCRSKFRHQNLELFKLGSSIPTSLCKTKEPYNICTEKNLQLCYQNQNGKKSEENVVKESITESIINTMEGGKKKETLWRSVSLNDKSENPNKPSNIIENNKNNSGRHILPAIVPEIPDRRKTKTPYTRENKTGTGEKAEKGCIPMETDLVIRKADPISINKRKSVVKRRKTAIGIEGSETEGRNVDGESVSDAIDVPNQETDSESVLGRRKSLSIESARFENNPINLSLKNAEQTSRVEITPVKTSNDPRLYTKQSQYLKQMLPNQCNTMTKPAATSVQNHEPTRALEQHNMPSSSTTRNDEPSRSYIAEQTRPQSQNRESAAVYTSGSNAQPTPSSQNHESARNYFTGPSNPPSSSIQNHEPAGIYTFGPNAQPTPQNHESARNYFAGPSNPPSSSIQNHEPAGIYTPGSNAQPTPAPQNHESARRNYFAGPSNPPSSIQNHEPSRIYTSGSNSQPTPSPQNHEGARRNYFAGPSNPPSSSIQNHESARIYIPGSNTQPTPSPQNPESARRNYFAGPSNPPSSSIQNHEPAKNYITALAQPSHNHEPARDNAVRSIKTPGPLLQTREHARSYFPVPCTSSNAPMPYYQNNFARANFPEIQQQMNRLDNATLPLQNRPVVPPAVNNEEVIKTIIQLVKSSMDPNFSIEILLILNRWYIELKLLSSYQNMPKKIKASITRTLNDVIYYISEKLFGVPCNSQLKSYIEQIIQVVSPHHKDLLTSLLPLLKINYNNEQWMGSVIKLLSQSLLPSPPDPRNQVNIPHNPGHNVANIHSNPIYNVPVNNHNYPHVPQNPPMPPQNYFYQNYRQPPLPYQGFPYQPNAPHNGNYLLNMEQIHKAGTLLGYPSNPLNAMEMQRNQQNIQTYQNFQNPGNYNSLPVSTVVAPEMYLSDNRCVPPKYGPNPNPEQGLQHVPQQNKPTKSKSKKKDRLDIIPITPAVTNSNTENQNHKSTNDQSTEPVDKAVKKQKKTNTSRQKLISPHSSETSTSSSNNEDQRTAPDVEELLQTNFIYNNGRTATNENTSNTIEEPPALGNSTTEKNACERTDENTIHVVDNFDNTHLPKELKTEVQENTDEDHHAVASTVIVKDKSMEITRGNSNEDSTATESANVLSNDIILEKVTSEKETSASSDDLPEDKPSEKETSASSSDDLPEDKPSETETSASPDDLPDNKRVLKEKLKDELYGITTKMTRVYGGDAAEVKLQIIKDIFGDSDDFLKYLLSKIDKKSNIIMNSNEVIMIDDDEDILIEKVEEMPKAMLDDGPPRLIKLLPLKRKENESDRERRDKKLRTGTSSVARNVNGNEIIIVDEDEEKENGYTNIEDIQNNSDCNQNYLSMIDDVTENGELPKDSPEEDPNSFSTTPDTDIFPDKTPATPNTLVVVANDAEKTCSPIVDRQMPSTVVTEVSAIEDISLDEETAENFRLCSGYEKDISANPFGNLEYFEVSHCNIINGTLQTIQNESNRDFFEKPVVYTQPVTPKRKNSEKSAEATTEELETAIAGRRYSCLSNITHFDDDSLSTTSTVSVQHAWDLNYVIPRPGRHYPASPAYHTSVNSVSPVSSPYLEDRYSRVSPRVSPNFRSPSRSVPTSPVCPSPSLAATLSPIASATTPTIAPLNNSRVNWQNWFAEEKKKGFFNFDRSQSVESESVSRRRSVDTSSSASSDYCSRNQSEEKHCEIKIDNKMYRIKRTIYDKIPKGKLCFIRESNTFIRYFDDNQMELFIRNLNIGGGSQIASDLLKQIKGRVEGLTDIETSSDHFGASGKNEVITMPKDVTLSAADNLSDPEMYVEEVEKVQRFMPRDFYGFYKYVTGYQIVNHHTPISFQTFLTMHNTNGIRGLFKSYVNTLIEGHAVL